MLRLVLGSVHSGKSRYLQSVVSSLLQDQKTIYYIVPEQLSYETEKSFLESFGVDGANRIRILTLTKLCEEIISKIGGKQAQSIDDSLKTVCMMTALQNLSGNLNYYKKGEKSLSFAKSMLSVIDEFKQSAIEPRQIEEVLPEISSSNLSNKLTDIALIYNSYNAVVNKNFIDQNDLVVYCASHLSGASIFSGATFIFDAFDGFMPNQHQLVEKIMLQAEDVYISLPCNGDIYESNDISVFANIKGEARKLLATAQKYNLAAAEPIMFSETDYNSNELKKLEQVLSECDEDIYSDDAKNITIVKSQSSYDELNYVCFEIKRLVAEEGYRYRDFAIVARECDAYSGALESISSKFNIPVFFDKRHSLINMPLFRLLLSALNCADKLTSESVFNMLKCGLLPFSVEDISLLENYCYIWNVDKLAWFDNWENNPSGLEKSREDTSARLDKLNGLRKNVVSIISELKSSVGDTATDITKALYKFITNNHIADALKTFTETLKQNGDFQTAQCQITAYDKIISVFNKLISCDDGRKISIDTYIELFFACADGETVGTVPHNLDTVMFCSSERARVTNAKIVFMLGVNQGKQPRLGNSSSLISNQERQILINKGVEIKDDLISTAIDEKFKFYASACAALDRVYFCYSIADFSMQSLEPSYIIGELISIFPRCRLINSADAQNKSFESFYDKQPAFEKTVSEYNNSSVEANSAYNYFANDNEYKNLLDKMLNGNKVDYSLAPNVAKKLYGERLYLSSTQIETFHNCAFHYFCRYGIGAKPIKKAEIDAVRRGTLVHYYLEKFITKHTEDYMNLDDTEVSEEIELIALDYLAELGLKEADLNEQLKFIFLELKNQIFFLIRDILNELSNSDFKPVACELHISEDNEISPLSVSFAGGQIFVGGIVDRVDLAKIDQDDYVRIVDYKTNSKKFKLNDILYGLNMQMLLYLYAIVKCKPYKIGGILYKPAKQQFVEQGVEGEPAIKSNGLFLRDEKVISAMDRTGRYISAGIKKGEVAEKDTATTKEFEIIFNYIDKILADMGNRLHGGLISARPIKGEESACKYCEYSSVCLTEDERRCRTIESRSQKEAIAELERRVEDAIYSNT